MIEDVVGYVRSFEIESRNWQDVLTDELAVQNVRGQAIYDISAELVEQVKIAIANNEEFSAYAPLAERLIENMRNYQHVNISDDLVITQLVNENIAGTAADLESGWERGTDPDRARRARKWKYGIYLPWTGESAGYQRSAKDEPVRIADYEEVINSRLRAWGDKAPYWYFLEYGTVGPYPWPTFGGARFIYKTKREGSRIIYKLMQQERDITRRQVEHDFERIERGERERKFVEEKEIADYPGYKRILDVQTNSNIVIRYRAPSGIWRSEEQVRLGL